MPFVVMIAGPNGSGKTTLTNYIRRQGIDLGQYINPDDIARDLEGSYDVRVRRAQQVADEKRDECLKRRVNFSFETVMSHDSKVKFFQQCRFSGFDTVLFFVGTRSPQLNVARVAQRVASGGHDVPVDRIVDRYARSFALLRPALAIAIRAAIYDNSDQRGLTLGLTKKTTARRGPVYSLMPDAPAWIAAAVPEGAVMERREARTPRKPRS